MPHSIGPFTFKLMDWIIATVQDVTDARLNPHCSTGSNWWKVSIYYLPTSKYQKNKIRPNTVKRSVFPDVQRVLISIPPLWPIDVSLQRSADHRLHPKLIDMLGHLGQCHLPPHNLQIKNFERISVTSSKTKTTLQHLGRPLATSSGEQIWQTGQKGQRGETGHRGKT